MEPSSAVPTTSSSPASARAAASHGRRGLFAAAAALAGAGLARLWGGSPAEAGHSSNDGIVHLGANNTNGTGTTTQISGAGGGIEGAIKVTNSSGRAITAVGSSDYAGMHASTSGSAPGMHGEAPSLGVKALATATGGTGLLGEGPGIGVKALGTTAGSTGLQAEGGGVGVQVVARDSGAFGGHFVVSSGSALRGEVGGGNAVVGIVTPANSSAFAGRFIGNTLVENGSFSVQNGVKSAVVPHPDGRLRRLYCVEATESYFEDFGRATLSSGQAQVSIDSTFGALIQTTDYYVQLTPEGDCRGLYVTEKTSTSFRVRELQGGTSSVTFSYRIQAKRKDIAAPRLEVVVPPPPILPVVPGDPISTPTAGPSATPLPTISPTTVPTSAATPASTSTPTPAPTGTSAPAATATPTPQGSPTGTAVPSTATPTSGASPSPTAVTPSPTATPQS